MRSFVVADKVYYSEILFTRILAKTSSELLEEYHVRLSGPEKHDCVEGRNVNTFVEYVYCEDNPYLASFKGFYRFNPIRYISVSL